MKHPADRYTRDAFGTYRGRPSNEARGLPPALTPAQRQAAYRARTQRKENDQRRAQLQTAEDAELYCRNLTETELGDMLAEAARAADRHQQFMCWVEMGRRNGWLK